MMKASFERGRKSVRISISTARAASEKKVSKLKKRRKKKDYKIVVGRKERFE